jgi:hypothetical protein
MGATMRGEPYERHDCDEQTPLDEVAERLKRLAREAKEAELARRLAKDRRRGSRDDG